MWLCPRAVPSQYTSLCFISPQQRFQDSAGTNKEVSHWERELSLCWAAVCPQPPAPGWGRRSASPQTIYLLDIFSIKPLTTSRWAEAAELFARLRNKSWLLSGLCSVQQAGQLLKAQLISKAPVKIWPQQDTPPPPPLLLWLPHVSSSSIPSAVPHQPLPSPPCPAPDLPPSQHMSQVVNIVREKIYIYTCVYIHIYTHTHILQCKWESCSSFPRPSCCDNLYLVGLFLLSLASSLSSWESRGVYPATLVPDRVSFCTLWGS